MENFNLNDCEELDFNEALSVVGGGFAYDAGHMLGSIGRDVLVFLLLKKL